MAKDDALATDLDYRSVKVLDRYQVAGIFRRGHWQRIPAGRAESRCTRSAHGGGVGEGWKTKDRGWSMEDGGVKIEE